MPTPGDDGGDGKADIAVWRSVDCGSMGVQLARAPAAHKQSNPIIGAAKDAGVAWALVEGYGVAAVKHGLERFLGGPRSPASLPVES